MTVNKNKFYAYIFVILLIFNGPLMIKCFINMPDYFTKGALLIWTLIGIVCNKISFSKRWVHILGVITAFLLIYIVGSRYDIVGCLLNLFITSILFYTFAYSLIKKKKTEDLFTAYVDVFVVIGAVSLFFWLFGSILNILPGSENIYYNWGNEINRSRTWFYLYFENEVQNQNLLGLTIPRNCGIFPEAPGYSGMLLYAIGLEWFGKEKISKSRFIILLLTLISTQSTKAIVTLIIVFVVKFIIDNRNVHKKSIIIIKRFAGIFLAGIAAYVIYAVLLDKSGTASYIVRLDDFNAAIKTWQSSKLFGVGYENDMAIIANTTTSWLRSNNGLTTGIAVLLAEGGLWLLCYYMLSFFMAWKSKIIKGHNIQFLLFALVVTLNLFASNCTFSMSMLLIVSFGYAANAVSLKMKKETLR